ncbi:hypothetical protein CBR_g54158 [Chara braunii]|uniref:Uncharacterized protein n=1 Tax=Chara braunii TaxID=69332 RepID=A0A388MBU2_CHABU|nr:hypothetical protein CBR_g54158 [Chara braunii]|eukprot:GBG92038.1 hypothetical protein CBR_g54158 [Chara braunii]
MHNTVQCRKCRTRFAPWRHMDRRALNAAGGEPPSVHVAERSENLGTGQGVEWRDGLRTPHCHLTEADVPWRSFAEDGDGAAQLGVDDDDGAAQQSCHQAGLKAGNGTVNRAADLRGSFLAAPCSSVFGATFRLTAPYHPAAKWHCDAQIGRFAQGFHCRLDCGARHCSLDSVHTQLIIDAMMTAYSQASKTYKLPILKLAPLGLEKPKPGVRAQRLKPEDWKDELADQYYYYAVAGQHNAGVARTLLGTDVAVRYHFERWPTRMVYFSNADFEGYFLVSTEDNKKDLKAPPRQQKLSMKDIRWCWKEKGYPRVVMGNPSGKQAQVESWRRFCEDALQKTLYNHLWTLADNKTEQGIRKQNAALRSYFPLAMAEESVWKMGMEFFEKWETGRLLAPEGAKWIEKKKKVKGVKAGVSHIENNKTGRKEVVYNIPVEAP